MASIPAGMESSDSEDDFIMHNYSVKNEYTTDHESSVPSASYESKEVSCSKLHNGFKTSPGNSETSHQQKRTSVHRQTGEFLDDLRVAVMQGEVDLVQRLFQQGIEIDCILKSGWTALMYACSRGNHEVVHYLLKNHADPNFHKDKFTPLMAVCASSKEAETNLHLCAKHLLEFGAEVNVWERHLMTPLMFAAREGRPSMVQELVRAGADVDRQDNRGWTALMWASSRGFGQVVRILLDSEADCNKLSINGQTATDIAYSCHHDIIGEILEKVSFSQEKLLDSEDKKKLQSWKQPNGVVPDNKHYIQYGELELFLCGLNVQELIPLFHQQRLTFHDLLVITEEQLEKIGVDQLGVRNKILESVREIHRKKWERGSLPNLRNNKFISCPDAVSLMGNIAQHLRYIEKSVAYLRSELQRRPRILELGQEAANVHRLLKETAESSKNCFVLHSELQFFTRHLEKVQDNVEYIPGDLIVEKALSPREERLLRRRRSIVLVVTGTVIALGYVLWRKPRAIVQFFSVPQSWHSISV